MSEQLANDGQPKACARTDGGKGVSEIMQPYALKTCMPTHRRPWPLQVYAPCACGRTLDDISRQTSFCRELL